MFGMGSLVTSAGQQVFQVFDGLGITIPFNLPCQIGLGEEWMARPRPFLFCRYEVYVGDEPIDGRGLFNMLQDLQGQNVTPSHAVGERYLDSQVMRPRRHRWEGQTVLTWTVGHEIEERVRATYNQARDSLELGSFRDGSVRYSDFVAVPDLGVLAVDDRSGELHLGGRQALNRFRAVIRMIEGADVAITYQATPQEVRRALKSWELSNFKFTIRPNNPRPVSRLAEALSEQLKQDFIGTVTGTAKPKEGDRMQMSDGGFINAASDLIEAGYGQMAIAGTTPDGLEAEIKKPRFDPDREKNERVQGKPRQLRVYVDAEEQSEEQIFATAAGSLMRFYGDDEN